MRALPPRRYAAGVAALIAAALGVTLLTPVWDEPDTAPTPKPAGTAGPLDEDAAQDQARRTGRRVEVTALRSATSTTHALPNGSFQLTAHAAPVRAKVGTEWKPIDTTLTRTDRGWAPNAAVDPVVFSPGSGRAGTTAPEPGHRASHALYRVSHSVGAPAATGPLQYSHLVTFTSAGHEVNVEWPGVLPRPVINGASALYEGVFEGVDLMLTARDSGFGHVLIVHDEKAAADPRLTSLPYRLSSPDLTFHLDPVTRVVTGKDAGGKEIAVSPTPFMWDSAGTPDTTRGEDPQPPEPPPAPQPSYSEEPGAPATDNPPGDGEDTPAPAPSPARPSSPQASPSTASPSSSPASPGPEESPRGDRSSHRSAHTTVTSAQGRTVTSALVARAGSSPGNIFGLPALGSPLPGSHAVAGEASLDGQGTRSAVLTITPDHPFLTGKDTVFPAFIDPPLTGKTKSWTTVYEKHPDSSFYDGANYNSGTTEARVGYESDTWGLSRSYFRLGWTSSLRGATVTDAKVRLLETYSWSCSGRQMELWQTDGITSRTTWNNKAAFRTRIGSLDFAHGYSSSCPDAYVTYEADAIAKKAADDGWTSLTIGLKVPTDKEDHTSDSAHSWKKFKAEGEAAPKILITYNRKPEPPSGLTMTPGPDCDSFPPYTSVGKSNLTFSAASRDDDGDLKALDFEVWESGKAENKMFDGNRTVDSTGRASVTLPLPNTRFTNGKQYFWRVRAIDSTGAASAYPFAMNCGFVYDDTAPNSPQVTSTDFPEDDGTGSTWSRSKFGTAGNFTFGAGTSADTVKYVYSFNNGSYDKSVAVRAGASATVSLKPPFAGPNVLYVKAVDVSGNMSPTPAKYLHYVSPRDTGDAAGDVTGDTYPDLLAIDAAGSLSTYPGDSIGDVHIHTSGAHDNGKPLPSGYWTGSDKTPALISHITDWYPGDGLTDLLARMPDGKLYTYPGDGYGSFDIEKRLEVQLPEGSPDPAALTQLVTTRDITGDKLPDAFGLAGDQLWAFTGYTGATFAQARLLSKGDWSARDIVNVEDITGDGIADLLFRTEDTGQGLLLRHGKRASTGGVDLGSLASASASDGGKDTVYGTNGWASAKVPMLRGTPDVNGDGVPDLWAVFSDGALYIYPGTRTGHGTPYLVGERSWNNLRALG